MRTARFAILGAAAVVLLFGCGPEPKRSTIYVLLPTSGNPFWQEVRRGAEAAKNSTGGGVQALVRAGATDTDASHQVAVMRQILASGGVGALVVGPASATEIVPTVVLYNRAKVPVVVIDSRLDEGSLKTFGAHVDAFIGSQNEHGAGLAAKYLADHLGTGETHVLILAGSPVQETAHERSNGFRAAAPKSWSTEERTANWSREEANQMARTLSEGSLPDAVFAANDEMALGFIEGLKAAGIEKSHLPLIVGFDATPDGRSAVASGELCATVAQDPFKLGQLGVETAAGLKDRSLRPPIERMVELSIITGSDPRCDRRARDAHN
jgi:ribose transport system substrate-binding protein